MKTLIIKWAVMAVALVIAVTLTAMVFPADIRLKMANAGEIAGVFVGVALLALVNGTIGNILKLLVLPLNCLTLGLASLLINGLLFWWVGTAGWGFEVKTFLAGLVGSVLYSVAGALLGVFLPDEESSKNK
jgi:putative membrane protein